jgi:hypothetical protein
VTHRELPGKLFRRLRRHTVEPRHRASPLGPAVGQTSQMRLHMKDLGDG